MYTCKIIIDSFNKDNTCHLFHLFTEYQKFAQKKGFTVQSFEKPVVLKVGFHIFREGTWMGMAFRQIVVLDSGASGPGLNCG